MKLKQIQNIFHKKLDALYSIEEVNSFFYMLAESYCHISRIKFALEPDLIIDKSEQESFFYALDDLKKEIPIQYVLGETEFYGLRFKLNMQVLIPRPETEELVDWILLKVQNSKKEHLNILDVGTGSGCIAISLAKSIPNATIYALDISKEALQIAKENAKINNVDINFIETDVLNLNATSLIVKNLKFDVIVSNPPYVREQEKLLMKANVLNNEPHLALFVTDDNPLQFYKAITTLATYNLKTKGTLFFEINEYLGNDMIHLLKEHNFSDIELKQDLFKKDRMIKGVKN